MKSENNMRRPCFLTWTYAAFWAVMVLGAMASSAEAAPFAYVANYVSGTISVIDTATNKVMATVPVPNPLQVAVTPDGKRVYVTSARLPGSVVVIDTTNDTVAATIPAPNPSGIAINPDGSHAYVTSFSSDASMNGAVSVIDTATNTVTTTVAVGRFPASVAVTPGGTEAYVTNLNSNTVSVIDLASNTVVATIGVGNGPSGIAVTPDGRDIYVTIAGPIFLGQGSVSIVDANSKTVTATVPVGIQPAGVAISPDGKRAYVSNFGRGNQTSPGAISVIDTGTKAVITTVGMGIGPGADVEAITPDGVHLYVTNQDDNSVSVLATATNRVKATIPVGTFPGGIGIIPPPVGVPFRVFNAKLEVHFRKSPNTNSFNLVSSFILGSASNGINPPTEPVTLKVGTFITTIPPGSFRGKGFGPFYFNGVIDGVRLEVGIKPTGAKRYAFHANAHDAKLAGTVSPVMVTLTIGDDTGTTSVKAESE